MNRKFKVWHGLLHGNMCTIYITLHINLLGVLGESPGNVGDLVSVPRSGRSPGEGNGNPLQYSCPENAMDRGA